MIVVKGIENFNSRNLFYYGSGLNTILKIFYDREYIPLKDLKEGRFYHIEDDKNGKIESMQFKNSGVDTYFFTKGDGKEFTITPSNGAQYSIYFMKFSHSEISNKHRFISSVVSNKYHFETVLYNKGKIESSRIE